MESGGLGEFTAVAFKVGDENASTRHLFVKKHDGIDDTKPPNKTLFILNVPQYLNKKCFKFLYKHCGRIVQIFIHSKPKGAIHEGCGDIFSLKEPSIGCKVAYVVFQETPGLTAALKCRELPPLPLKMINTSLGLSKWIQEYNSSFLNVPEVTQEIETYMMDFDRRQNEEKQKSKDMEADEEGWVTVSKFSKSPKIPRSEKVSKRIIEKQKKAAEKQTLLKFYKCQLRDAKMQQILELRKKFEKDKERIAFMKANRKFKPF